MSKNSIDPIIFSLNYNKEMKDMVPPVFRIKNTYMMENEKTIINEVTFTNKTIKSSNDFGQESI